MKFAKRLLMVAGAVALAGIVGVALVPRAAHAIVSTLVTVVNTPSVKVTNTPSVNVNSMPAVNVASVSGKLSVANSLDANGNPIPIGVQEDEFAIVESSCSLDFSGSKGGYCKAYTVPTGDILVIDDVSMQVLLTSDVPSADVLVTNGSSPQYFNLFLGHEGATLGGGTIASIYDYVDNQRTHFFAYPGGVYCEANVRTAQSIGNVQCTIAGHLVPVH